MRVRMQKVVGPSTDQVHGHRLVSSRLVLSSPPGEARDSSTVIDYLGVLSPITHDELLARPDE